VPFNVLNAKQHQKEAGVVAQAGRKGSVTISTNMAGRGTDILLGGNAEFMAKEAVAAEREAFEADAAKAEQAPLANAGEASTDDDAGASGEGEGMGPYRGATRPAFDEEERMKHHLAIFKAQCEAERAEVLKAGGLKIIGTERHESRRIDNQLRGRAGRQGDPGVSRFYLSLEDDLLRIFGLDRMAGLMERLGLEEDTPIESGMVTKSIENAQKKVEGRNFDQRKNVLEYDDVMNQQRKTIYALRRQILEGSYAPTPPEDKDGKPGAPLAEIVESGGWTIPVLAKEMRADLAGMVGLVIERVAERDAKIAAGEPISDRRPVWRVLQRELWRQHGTWIDLERSSFADGDRERLIDLITERVAKSLIQQRERIYDLGEELIDITMQQYCPAEKPDDEWDLDGLEEALVEQFGCEFELEHGDREEVSTAAWKVVEKRLDEREAELKRPWLMYFARMFLLEEIDDQWVEHLKTMDALREGIGLQGYGQKDPKKEYKKQGFVLFQDMMTRITTNVGTKLFHVQHRRADEAVPVLHGRQRQTVEAGAAGKVDVDEAAASTAAGRRRQRAPGRGGAAAMARGQQGEPQEAAAPVRRERPKVGRNDPCPCGSGRKYKKCHGKDEADAANE
jgi:preprotein translocase subunit SecA